MRKSVIALVPWLFVLPVQAHATARIRLTSDWNNGYVCNVSSGSDFAIVTAILEYTSATGVAFAVAVDPAGGYVLQSYGSTFGVTGDVTSGVDINFGRCMDYPVHVMQFVLVRASAGDPCSYFSLAPHPAYGMTTYTDCLSIQREVRHGSGIILNSDGTCDQARPPYDPYPPHGATGVSLLTQLEWSFDEPECCTEISGRRDVLYFGTAPNPPLKWDVSSPEQVGPLQPMTTYYWMIGANAYGCAAASPVWSFTTTSKVATQQSTWGAIKALYR